jgi:hypothetical protein
MMMRNEIEIMTLKRWRIVMIVLTLCAVVISMKIFFDQSAIVEHTEFHPSSSQSQPKPATINVAVNKTTEQVGDNKKAEINNIETWVGSDQQNAELKTWAQSRGWIDITYRAMADYETYNKETLERMANEDHNMQAMMRLGIEFREYEWLEKAAVYGSSFALTCLAIKDLPIGKPAEEQGSEETQRLAYIESLAYKKAAELRNDYYTSQAASKSRYKQAYGITLTEEDIRKSEKRAQEIYNNLEAQREKLGLGKFDNSVPPSVEAYYRYFELKK